MWTKREPKPPGLAIPSSSSSARAAAARGWRSYGLPRRWRKPAKSARRMGRANYGDDSLYLERYIERPVHLEVQIFNGVAVGIRKCAVQRKNQKIIEETGETFLDERSIRELVAAAENMAAISGYAEGSGAGTVEFLLDGDTGEFGFLEVNTRMQVSIPSPIKA